jgi:D-3-phosphoglycerate dehydrogenase
MKVLITDKRHGSIEEERAILEPAGVTLESAFCRNEEELIRRGRGASAFLVSFAPITRRVLESLPDLKLIVRYGVGVDNVDVGAARELGKLVARVPDYCVDEVAAHTLALILAGLRGFQPLGQAIKNGNWIKHPSAEKLRRPNLLTAGIVGLGRVGRRVAECLQPLVARIIFYDPYVSTATAAATEPAGGDPAERVGSRAGHTDWVAVDTLPELARRSQILTIHAPMNEHTQDLIDTPVLAEARELILVNTARAGLVSREALEAALNEGRVRFFGSDVFWQEPPDYSDPATVALLKRRDVLVTPHMAWYSTESEREVRRKAAEEVLRFIRGESLRHPV